MADVDQTPTARAPSPIGRRVSGRALLASCLVLAFAESVWFVLGLTGSPEPAAVGWIAAPVAMAMCAATLFRTAGMPGIGIAGRRFWRQLGVGCVFMLASVIVQAIGALEKPGHVALPANTPRVAVVGYLVAVLIPFWALIRLPGTAQTVQARLRLALDSSTVAIGGGLFVYYFFFAGSNDRSGGSGFWGQFVVGLLAMAVLATLTKILLSGAGPIDPGALRALALCMLIGGLSPALFQITNHHPQLAPPQLTDAFIATAVIYGCLRQQRAPRRAPSVRTDRERPRTWLPYLAVVATDALLLVGIFQPDDDRQIVVAVCAVAVTLLVVTRQLAAMHENEGLLAQLREQREILRHRVTHDALTTLANRDLFRERTEQELAAGADEARTAVLLIDLDDFKAVNDTLGHSVGDQLLVAVAARLRECVRPFDVVARLGGDEFAILLAGVDRSGIDGIVDRVLASFSRAIVVESHSLLVRASVGVAVADERDETGDLLRNADIAMYAAKAGGKGRHAYYSTGMHAELLERSELAAQLQEAIDHGQLRLVFQPVVRLPGGSPIGVEALVRWQHPARGLLAPGAFIPTAEQTGLIVPLGRWVMVEACHQLGQWRRDLGEAAPKAVGVNVAAPQLRQPGYAADVLSIIAAAGLTPDDILLEVTETAVVEGGSTFDALRELRTAGVRIGLDDFGTGQSSLGLLRECPVDVLKLDKSFVEHVAENREQAAIAEAVLHIAQALGLAAVAEGVESEAQAGRLYDIGYRFAQGFHFARPVPPAQIPDYFGADRGADGLRPRH